MLVIAFRLVSLMIILTAAMVPVALAVNWWNASRSMNPGTLLLGAPLVYVGWLMTLMVLFRIVLAPTKFFFPKPRFLEVTWTTQSMMAMAAIGLSYQVATLLRTLPLMPVFTTMPGLRSLYWHAYSRPPRMGRNFVCYGDLLDPDLVEIGDDVILGSGASLNAHSFVTRDHNFTYITGPIRIGSRVTIGANSSIGMFSVIEDDVIIQASTRMGRTKHVGRGEVWGGSPARFLRMAEGFEHLANERNNLEDGDDSSNEVHPDATSIR